jgi:hypothetical protein
VVGGIKFIDVGVAVTTEKPVVPLSGIGVIADGYYVEP